MFVINIFLLCAHVVCVETDLKVKLIYARIFVLIVKEKGEILVRPSSMNFTSPYRILSSVLEQRDSNSVRLKDHN